MNATRTSRPARGPKIVVADLAAEHLEELDFLWGQAQLAREIPGATLAWLDSVRVRMRANALGLEVALPKAQPLLTEALLDKSPSLTAAAAHALLATRVAAHATAVLDAFASAAPAGRPGLRDAVQYGPAPRFDARSLAPVGGGDALAGVLLAEAAAAHGAALPAPPYAAWCAHEEPAVRAGACRVAAWTNASPPELERLAREDADAQVRSEALEAGAWARAPWAAAHARACLQSRRAERPEAVWLGCLLAGSGDGELVRALVQDTAFGPLRFDFAAGWGRPAVFGWLLEALGGPEAKDAEAAGAAFVRMAGRSLPTSRKGDAAEAQPEALLVDEPRARALHAARREEWDKGRRWAGGLDVGQSLDGVAGLDLASRHETLLRGRQRGEWPGARREWLLLPEAPAAR